MGNSQGKKQKGKKLPYSLSIEFYGQQVNAGETLTGQAVLQLSDVYESLGGLDKAVLTFTGIEYIRFCDQKKTQPKKILNRTLHEHSKEFHKAVFNIHDFLGHKKLNGGRYNMPFTVPVPESAAPSLEVSPVEMSMLEIAYFVEVEITQKGYTEKKGKKVQGGRLINASKPIRVSRLPKEQPVLGFKHEQVFKESGLSKLLTCSKEFAVTVVQQQNIVAHHVRNNFQFHIDNSKSSSQITAVRVSLVRTVSAGADAKNYIKVVNEEIAVGTHSGGPAGQTLTFQIVVPTPSEMVEKHLFNTPDGSTKYGSLLAPSHSGSLLQVSYQYEIRIWAEASWGQDKCKVMHLPVMVACQQGNYAQPRLPARRNSGGMQRNPIDNFLNEMVVPNQRNAVQHPLSTRNSQAVQKPQNYPELREQPVPMPNLVPANLYPNPYAGVAGAVGMQAGAAGMHANQPMMKPFGGEVVHAYAVDEDPVISAPIGIGMPVIGMNPQVNLPSQPLAPMHVSQVPAQAAQSHVAMKYNQEPIEPMNIAPLDLNEFEEEKKEEDPAAPENPVQMGGWQMPADMMAAFQKEDRAQTPSGDREENAFRDDLFDSLPGERRPSIQVWGKSAEEVQPQDM